MLKKQVGLVKVDFFLFTIRTKVVIKPRQSFRDRPGELPDWTKLRLFVSLPTLFVLFVASSLLFFCSSGALNSSTCDGAQPGVYPDQGCTIFYAADDSVALAGNNEDYDNPYTYVWFVPPEPGKYGRVYFGFEDGFPQGGVNEKGLFFDGAALSYKALSQPDARPVYDDVIPPGFLFDKIMSECAIVSEALVMLNSYSHVGMDTYQLLFGDASGDSMIVDGDTILRKQGSLQVATNFRLSEDPNPPYPCRRYNTAWDRLSQADSFSVELFRDILNATHQEDTVYSNVYDLRNGQIYLYYYHDFETVVVIDVAAELAQGFHFYRLASLFPANTEAVNLPVQRLSVYETQAAERTVPIEPGQYDDYIGDYREGLVGEIVSVYVEEDRLYVRQHFSLPVELLAEAEDQFFHLFHNGVELKINFERDSQGAVVGVAGVLFGEEFQLDRLKYIQPTAQPTPVVDVPKVSPFPTVVSAPVTDDSVRAVSWWGWALAALGAIVIAAAVRLVIKRYL